MKIVFKEKDWKHILWNVSETDGFRKIVHIVSISEHIFFMLNIQDIVSVDLPSVKYCSIYPKCSK